jgi:hypothetical protein
MDAEDRIPDYQKAAVVFIGMQITHLDAQRSRLVEAREFLLGLVPVPGVAAATVPKPVPGPSVPVLSLNGHQKKAPRNRIDWEGGPDKLAAALKDGPLGRNDLSERTGIPPHVVYTMLRNRPKRFRIVEAPGRMAGRWTTWELVPVDAVV